MGAWNFRQRWADAVEQRIKRQTIRARRRDGRDPRVGDRQRLYVGQRTAYCRLLGECTVRRRRPIDIDADGETIRVVVDGQRLTMHHVRDLAVADGFEDASAFLAFFREAHGLPFSGFIYNWD